MHPLVKQTMKRLPLTVSLWCLSVSGGVLCILTTILSQMPPAPRPPPPISPMNNLSLYPALGPSRRQNKRKTAFTMSRRIPFTLSLPSPLLLSLLVLPLNLPLSQPSFEVPLPTSILLDLQTSHKLLLLLLLLNSLSLLCVFLVPERCRTTCTVLRIRSLSPWIPRLDSRKPFKLNVFWNKVSLALSLLFFL